MTARKTIGTDPATPLGIIVLGASGDLARKKVIPALFALYCQDFLPQNFRVFGFARHPMTCDEFRNRITEHLTCRHVPGHACATYMDEFLSRCFYVQGQYGARDAFVDLYARMRTEEGDGPANRMFYMAIPPFLFLDVARALGDAGLVSCAPGPGWSRTVIEKPFGRDRRSSDELAAQMGQVFTEDQTFRIDHYLGKEIVQNLLVLRFANLIFGPIWNRSAIDHVKISWKEDFGIEERGGYFDEYGIMRDVMQNHLLQILALVAMEQPARFDAKHIRDEKVSILRSIPALTLDDLVLGQYRRATYKGEQHPSYTEEAGVPPGSRTPTFASAVLHINNARWDGVPFQIAAGKALDDRLTEIRIRFRHVPDTLFQSPGSPLPANELVIRVQPDEAIFFTIINKAPGIEMNLVETALNLRYESAFGTKIPDAYECLLLDVIRGDRALFIRSDELAAAWDIFTPVLHEIEKRRVAPEPYEFGGKGPAKAVELAARYGIA